MRTRGARDERRLRRDRPAARRTGSPSARSQIELEAAAQRHGGDAMAYDTIVGSGPNSAVLHFPPSARAMHTGELVLIDAGAAYRGYASDITRTYPVGGRLGGRQRELHALVHAAERAAIERCAPGTEWRDVHLTAAQVIADGLVDQGILRGGRDEPDRERRGVAVLPPRGRAPARSRRPRRRRDPRRAPSRAAAVSQPAHRPAAGCPGSSSPSSRGSTSCRRSSRTRTGAGATATRSPGSVVDGLLEFGGIRIEDNVLIGAAGHEVLTADVPLLG